MLDCYSCQRFSLTYFIDGGHLNKLYTAFNRLVLKHTPLHKPDCIPLV